MCLEVSGSSSATLVRLELIYSVAMKCTLGSLIRAFHLLLWNLPSPLIFPTSHHFLAGPLLFSLFHPSPPTPCLDPPLPAGRTMSQASSPLTTRSCRSCSKSELFAVLRAGRYCPFAFHFVCCTECSTRSSFQTVNEFIVNLKALLAHRLLILDTKLVSPAHVLSSCTFCWLHACLLWTHTHMQTVSQKQALDAAASAHNVQGVETFSYMETVC